MPESIYQQLLEDDYTYADRDGIITEKEYRAAKMLCLKLDGIESIECLERLETPKHLYFSGANISDFSC